MKAEDAVEILLIEDNANDIELTLRALKNNNLANKVTVVRDGAEALEFIFAEGSYAKRKIEDTPKVILLDLKLPKVSGLDILRRIKSDERTKLIPVVVLTSSREERDLIETYELGVNSYIEKPIDFNSFMTAVSGIGFYWVMLNKRPQLKYKSNSD